MIYGNQTLLVKNLISDKENHSKVLTNDENPQ